MAFSAGGATPPPAAASYSSEASATGASLGRERGTTDECQEGAASFFPHTVDLTCSYKYIQVLILGRSLQAAGNLQSTHLKCQLLLWRGDFREG